MILIERRLNSPIKPRRLVFIFQQRLHMGSDQTHTQSISLDKLKEGPEKEQDLYAMYTGKQGSGDGNSGEMKRHGWAFQRDDIF